MQGICQLPESEAVSQMSSKFHMQKTEATFNGRVLTGREKFFIATDEPRADVDLNGSCGFLMFWLGSGLSPTSLGQHRSGQWERHVRHRRPAWPIEISFSNSYRAASEYIEYYGRIHQICQTQNPKLSKMRPHQRSLFRVKSKNWPTKLTTHKEGPTVLLDPAYSIIFRPMNIPNEKCPARGEGENGKAFRKINSSAKILDCPARQ